jgi:hypothetical protein
MAWDVPPQLDDPGAAAADVVVVTRDGPKQVFADAYDRLVPSHLVRTRIAREADGRDWSRIVGAQIRHGNGEPYLTPASTDWFHERIAAVSCDIERAQVFLATDSVRVVEEFAERYVDLITVPKWYPPVDSGPLHHHPGSPDRFAGAVDAIVDMWLLARCRHLLICDGGFGRTARARSARPPSAVEVYPDKIYATVAEKADWDNPI